MKIAALLSLLLAALPARSQEERKFGDPGVVVPSGSLSVTTQSGGVTVVDLQPGLQFFTTPNVALGLSLIYFHFSAPLGSNSIYGIAPSLGYNLRLGDPLSIFPQVSLSLESATNAGSSQAILGASLFVPVLIHPVRHFFLGFGPDFLITGPTDDLFNTRAFSVRTVIGGWL
jgi:hypothetical protein